MVKSCWTSLAHLTLDAESPAPQEYLVWSADPETVHKFNAMMRGNWKDSAETCFFRILEKLLIMAVNLCTSSGSAHVRYSWGAEHSISTVKWATQIQQLLIIFFVTRKTNRHCFHLFWLPYAAKKPDKNLVVINPDVRLQKTWRKSKCWNSWFHAVGKPD